MPWQVGAMRIINWFQIPAVDIERAVKFYGAVFEAKFQQLEHAGERHAFFAMDTLESERTGGEIVAAPNNKPSTDGVRIYLGAPGGVEATLAKVEPAGGRVLTPTLSIGENGWIAIIADTEGNSIGLHSMSR